MNSIMKAFDLTGKTALVTGASRGLGLQIAEALADQGARLVISSRKAEDLEVTAKQLQDRGAKVEWIAADNGKDQDIARLADDAIAKLNIPTGIPLVYRLDADLRPVRTGGEYLDADAAAAAIEAVKNQGR